MFIARAVRGIVNARVVLVVILLSPPWKWPHEWPKLVGGHCVIKWHPQNQSAFVIFLIYFMPPIHTRNMEHIKMKKAVVVWREAVLRLFTDVTKWNHDIRLTAFLADMKMFGSRFRNTCAIQSTATWIEILEKRKCLTAF